VRSKLSTKPDDKVYGLYSILDSLQFSKLPKVDYNRPVHETYTEMAIAVINSEKSLDILYHTCVPQLIPHLPSWVPDWSNTAYFRPVRVASSHGSGSSNPSYSFSKRTRKALYNVLVQNAILGVFTVHSYELQVAINNCMGITIASSSDLEILQKSIQNTPEYAETLTDFSLLLGVSPEISMWPVELQIRFVLRLVNSKVTLVQHEIFLNTYHKTLIVTQEGYIGTCPRWAKPGDLVLLVAGLQTPFIVREGGGEYRMIGPAYVEGVMNGEKLRLFDVVREISVFGDLYEILFIVKIPHERFAYVFRKF
jgi:hypothetical protein